MKNKKTLADMNNGERYKHYRNRSAITLGAKFVSIFSPFAVIFGVKAQEYISIVESTGSQVKFTIGGILAIIVACIAVLKEFKALDKENGTKLSGVVAWGVAFAFAFLFSAILQDLTLILGAEFAGQVAGKGFDIYSEYAKGEANEYKKLAKEDNTYYEKKHNKIVQTKEVEIGGII